MKTLPFVITAILLASSAGVTGYLSHHYLSTSEIPPAQTNMVRATDKSTEEPIKLLPDFELPDRDGVQRSSAEWHGKLRVINFWATWCPPCLKEIPIFVKLQTRYADRDVQFIGIAIDNAADVNTFADKLGINYPILIEERKAIRFSQQLGNHFGALPFTVFVDQDGRIIERHAGELDYETTENILLPLLTLTESI